MAPKEIDLQKRVEEFFSIQKSQRIISQDHSLTILRLIEQNTPFGHNRAQEVLVKIASSPQIKSEELDKIKHLFLEALSSFNEFNPARRFFTSELVSLFDTPEKLKITVETLLLANHLQLTKIAAHYLRSFLGTNQVIEILVHCDEIYNANEVEIKEQTLKSFRLIFSQKLLALFSPVFLEEQQKLFELGEDQNLELLKKILSSLAFDSCGPKLLGRNELFAKLAEVITFAQAHRWQPIYAKKRYDYLRLYLQDLTHKPVIKGIAPANLSKVVACFIFCNQQLQPNKKLIELLVDGETFEQEATQEALETFLSHLAPTTIDALLSDIRDFLSQLLQSDPKDIEDALEQVSKNYKEKLENPSLLGRFYGAAMDLKHLGVTVVNQVNDLTEEIIETFHKEEDEQRDTATMEQLFGGITSGLAEVAPFKLIPKNQALFDHFKAYQIVSTNIIGLLGANIDCGKHNLEGAIDLFGGKANISSVKKIFLQLFHYLQETQSRSVTINEFPNPIVAETVFKEYYLPILVPSKSKSDYYLLCIGIGYCEHNFFDSSMSKEVQNESCSVPYCLLFSTATKNNVMNALSRKVATQDKKIKELEFKPLNQKLDDLKKVSLKALLDLLHLIPFNHWEEADMQNFLIYLEGAIGLPIKNLTIADHQAI
ncbi:MAG: hypothetical protein QNL04_14020 [SAR324 cluster bacterium]|nr:hypothetical protein [SAR324 cluster bacterium]